MQTAEGGEQSPPFGKLEKKPMENILIICEGFGRIFLTFAPTVAVGAVVMWITTRK